MAPILAPVKLHWREYDCPGPSNRREADMRGAMLVASAKSTHFFTGLATRLKMDRGCILMSARLSED